jgi:transcriptional regulator with XRE-family HTH domain
MIGDVVRQLRRALGWNQKRLAEESSVAQGTISRVENGQLTQLKSDTLDRIATATGVTVDFLLERRTSESADEWDERSRNLSDWISVKDQQPEVNERVLVWSDREDVLGSFGRGCGIDWRDEGQRWFQMHTHWMPLPKPPEDEMNEKLVVTETTCLGGTGQPGLVKIDKDGKLLVQGGVWPNGLQIVDERE